MRSPEVIYACRWLIRDTFRQALANRVVWVMLGACGIVILFCLSITIEGGESLRPTGDISVVPLGLRGSNICVCASIRPGSTVAWLRSITRAVAGIFT